MGFEGWRWLLVLGSLGSVVVYLLRRGLLESPRWLEAVGRQSAAEQVMARFEVQARSRVGTVVPPPVESVELARPQTVRVRTLLHAPFGRRTAMLVIFHLLQTFGYYGFGTLVPIVLTAKGYSVASSLAVQRGELHRLSDRLGAVGADHRTHRT